MGTDSKRTILFFWFRTIFNLNNIYHKMDFKQKILLIIISAAISTFAATLVSSVTTRNNRINNAAPKEYVDKQDEKIYNYVDKQDRKLFDYSKKIDSKQEESNKDFSQKFDRMYEMVIDIWKERKK